MFKAIRIGLINWYCDRRWFGNIIRNLVCPIWIDFEYRFLDFNITAIGAIILLIIILNKVVV